MGRVALPCTLHGARLALSCILAQDCILDGKYDILWFEGEQMPNDIAQNIEDQPVKEGVDIEMEQCESDEFDYESDSD